MRMLLFAIKVYQRFVSPFLPTACRFYPSCSEYAKLSIAKYGKRGILKAIRRILSCHPFHLGGYDAP
jgi:hypothetical protein